jgi:hypothetical protein
MANKSFPLESISLRLAYVPRKIPTLVGFQNSVKRNRVKPSKFDFQIPPGETFRIPKNLPSPLLAKEGNSSVGLDHGKNLERLAVSEIIMLQLRGGFLIFWGRMWGQRAGCGSNLYS